MNDLNPNFLALLGFAVAVGALVAGGTGALVAIAAVTGVALLTNVIGGLLA